MRALLPAMSAALILASSAPTWAREPLDGTYLTLGPVGAGAHVAGEWVTAVGGELSVVQVVEDRFPAALGVSGGGVSYGGRSGGRLWLEVEAATGGPLPLGLGAGVTTEVDHMRPYRLGGQATAWIFIGIVPYVRVGMLQETGRFLEAGVMFKIPARRFP